MSVSREYDPSVATKNASVQVEPMYSSDINEQASGVNTLLQGATLRTSTAYGRAATVKAGEDIRPALNSLKSAGGGTLILLAGTHRPAYDIVGGSNISIIGEGIDQTVLDFAGGVYQIYYEGTTSNITKNFSLRDFTVQNSGDTDGGIYINLCDNFVISSVKVYSCDYEGMYLRDVQNVVIDGCVLDANTGHNFYLYGSDVRGTVAPAYEACVNITINNTRSENSGASGFYLEVNSATAAIKYFTMNSCFSRKNTGSGFYIMGSSPYESFSSLIGCVADDNGSYGFFSSLGRISLYGCHAVSNTSSGFEIGALNSPSVLIGCHSSSNSPEINVNENTIVVGNVLSFGASFDSFGAITETDTLNSIIGNNANTAILTSKQTVRAKNTSGGSLAVGDVVVLKPVAGGMEVTTTTTAGDKKVFGISLSAPSNNNWGSFLVFGKTSLLKVDGTTDIAIGDYLTTFTTAKIAQKATTTGHMVFAVALEAYTSNDSNGVIDAYLLPYHFPLS